MSTSKKFITNVFKPEEGYDLWAKHYDGDKNEKLAFLNTFDESVIFKMIGDIENKKILDLGCGTGRLFKGLMRKEADLYGADISQEMLNVASKKYSKVKFVKASAYDLPFTDDQFDIVVCAFLIVHLNDLEKAFSEVYRVLKPNGVFILTNINQRKAPKLTLNSKEEIVIKSFYHRPEDVIKALEDVFFEIEDEDYVNSENGNVWINQIIKAVKK